MIAAFSKMGRGAEGFLWLLGIACLGVFLYLTAEREISAQAEVERFLGSIQSEPLPPAPLSEALDGLSEPDQRLWSEQRVRAFDGTGHTPAQAVLRVPVLGLEAPVFEGFDDATLDRGLGWITGTAPIGATDNVAIAGHRDSFFRSLKDIEPGDAIEVVGPESTIRYRVTETWIVDPGAVEVLDPTGYAALTLVTCYPFYYVGHAPQRFIVRAAAEELS